jgi:hypothetical protein
MRLKAFCSLVGFGSLILLGSYVVYATLARPTHRDVLHGFVYRMPAHGLPVYLSGLDVAIIAALLAAIVASAGLFDRFKTK